MDSGMFTGSEDNATTISEVGSSSSSSSSSNSSSSQRASPFLGRSISKYFTSAMEKRRRKGSSKNVFTKAESTAAETAGTEAAKRGDVVVASGRRKVQSTREQNVVQRDEVERDDEEEPFSQNIFFASSSLGAQRRTKRIHTFGQVINALRTNRSQTSYKYRPAIPWAAGVYRVHWLQLIDEQTQQTFYKPR
jgi:hypothetical protein